MCSLARRGFEQDLLDCEGTDALAVLAAATRLLRPRGLSPTKQVDPATLGGMLRVAFDLADLEDDELFWRMKQWEYATKRRYPLLRPWRLLDPLQALWDQRYWRIDLEWMLRLVGERGVLAAFKLDLDNFKAVNSALGHSGGDEGIGLYCAIVREIAGRVGEAYRRGGDEVVAFVPGLDESEARRLAEEIRFRVEQELAAWGRQRGLEPPYPTASIGVVLASGRQPPEEVVHLMDTAQEQAKRDGKNRVVFLA